jgi:hypothetical protein
VSQLLKDCYLGRYSTCAKAPTYYRYINIFRLRESEYVADTSYSPKYEDSDVTDKSQLSAAGDNQSVAITIANVLLSEVKFSAAYVRVIISTLLTKKSRCFVWTLKYGVLAY